MSGRCRHGRIPGTGIPSHASRLSYFMTSLMLFTYFTKLVARNGTENEQCKIIITRIFKIIFIVLE